MNATVPADALFHYTLRLADNALILSHRLSQWCGHGPFLEEELALTNTALDLLGRARLLYGYAGQIEGHGRDEDDLAYHRDEREFYNYLLMEQPKGDFAYTIVRQFYVDVWNLHFYSALGASNDRNLAGIANKVIKECRYHCEHSAEWVRRLGDGTATSQQRMMAAISATSRFINEMFEMDAVDEAMLAAGIGVDLNALQTTWRQHVDEVFLAATLARPEPTYDCRGGRQGLHTEQLGYLLAEMQYVQRCHSGLQW